jgi:hypothetical protein
VIKRISILKKERTRPGEMSIEPNRVVFYGVYRCRSPFSFIRKSEESVPGFDKLSAGSVGDKQNRGWQMFC